MTRSKKELKLAILSEDFKDLDILNMLLDTEIEKEEDINEIFEFLKVHRPLVLKELKDKI